MSGSAAAEIKRLMGIIPAFILMVCLSPVFFVLSLLYVYSHPNRGDVAAQEIAAGELAPMNY